MFILKYDDNYLKNLVSNPKQILAEMFKSNNVIVQELKERNLWTIDLRIDILSLFREINEQKEIVETFYIGSIKEDEIKLSFNKQLMCLLDIPNYNIKNSINNLQYAQKINELYDRMVERKMDITPLINILKNNRPDNVFLNIFNDHRYIDNCLENLNKLKNNEIFDDTKFDYNKKLIITNNNQKYIKSKLIENIDVLKKIIKVIGLNSVLEFKINKNSQNKIFDKDLFPKLSKNGEYEYIDLLFILAFLLNAEKSKYRNLFLDLDIHEETLFMRLIENQIYTKDKFIYLEKSTSNFLTYIVDEYKNIAEETGDKALDYVNEFTYYKNMFDKYLNFFHIGRSNNKYKDKDNVNVEEFLLKCKQMNKIDLFISVTHLMIVRKHINNMVEDIKLKIKEINELIESTKDLDLALELNRFVKNIYYKLENVYFSDDLKSRYSFNKIDVYHSSYIVKYMNHKFGLNLSLNENRYGDDNLFKIINEKKLTLEDYEKNIFYDSMKLNTPITENQIKFELQRVGDKRFAYKNQMLFDIYEKNLDNISFFWNNQEYLDVVVINKIYQWFKKNKDSISNLDLEIMNVNELKVIDGLIKQELFLRNKNNIVVPKKYTLSKREQLSLFFDESILSESKLTLWGLIDFNEINVGYKINTNMSYLKMIQDKIGKNIILNEKFKYLKENFIKNISNEDDNEFVVEDKFFPTLNSNEDKKFLESLSKTIMNYDYSSFDFLNKNRNQLIKALYRTKTNPEDVFKIDALSFWRKIMVIDIFDIDVNLNISLKRYDDIIKSRSYIIPEQYKNDEIISVGMEILNRYRKEEIIDNVSPDNILKTKQKLFYLAKKYGVLKKETKMIIEGYVLEYEMNRLDEISYEDMKIVNLRFSSDYSESNYVQLYTKIFNNMDINSVNIKSILNKNLIVPELKPNNEISMKEKIEIFLDLIDNVFLLHSDINKQLNSFCNYLDFVGGYKEIIKYIDENPIDQNLKESFCIACFYFISLLAKEEEDPKLIKFIRNFEYVASKSKDLKFNALFKNPIYNMKGLIREVSLRENFIRSDNQDHNKKKI